MTLSVAVRMTECLFAFAYLIQNIEFIRGLSPEKYLAAIRVVLCLLLLCNVQPLWVESALLATALYLLYRFQGPYNGGSDRMSMLVLVCVWLSHLLPHPEWQRVALGYLVFQVVFSYVQSGWVKIINAEWRNGAALTDVFAITAYPVSESVRHWSQRPQLLWAMSWSVMLFELLFPVFLLHTSWLVFALLIALLFHFANATLFGLNRFFWIWPSAYPLVIWFQQQVIAPFLLK